MGNRPIDCHRSSDSCFWQNGRFSIKSDADWDENSSSSRTLYFERNLSYRLRLDDKTYSKAFMIGTDPKEDSDKAYDKGVLGNGTGQGDLLLRFDDTTPDLLHYFCPDEEGAGGEVRILDYYSDRPHQRNDLLLTFSFGSPLEAYQILVPEVLDNLRENPNKGLPPYPTQPFLRATQMDRSRQITSWIAIPLLTCP